MNKRNSLAQSSFMGSFIKLIILSKQIAHGFVLDEKIMILLNYLLMSSYYNFIWLKNYDYKNIIQIIILYFQKSFKIHI